MRAGRRSGLGWGRNFSAEDKDVLAHIYDRDFERMLGLLKQAEFNWIWVTWSSGWSFKDEDENRENLKNVIARCHENGIHVLAYLSASNMFRTSANPDDPETKKFGLWMHGIPMFYAGPTKTDLKISWDRRLADTRKPGWRAYLLKKAEMAVDAGMDAIMWDDMIGYDDGPAQLLDDTQWMAVCKGRESGRPKVMVYANIHMSPDRFGMNDINEAIWEEDGKDTPGVWDGHGQVDNARQIKFLSGEKQLWQPLKYENDLYHCGPRERCIPSPTEQSFPISEAYVFGAATSRNIEGLEVLPVSAKTGFGMNEFIDFLGLRRAGPREMNVSLVVGVILIAKGMPMPHWAISRSLSFVQDEF